MTSVTSIDKIENHSHPTDSAIEENRQKGLSKRQKRRNRRQEFKPTKVSAREVKPQSSDRQIRCFRCGSSSLALSVARVSGVLRNTGWITPLACFQYIKCANCNTIQDKELNKALVKGGLR